MLRRHAPNIPGSVLTPAFRERFLANDAEALIAAQSVAWPSLEAALPTVAVPCLAYAGTAPVTRASGRSRVVSARYIRNRRLAAACHWWAFSAITRSPGARAHYDRRRAAGDSHVAALRNVANRLLSRLWYCLRTGTPYDEHAAWAGPGLDTRVA